MSNYLQIAVGYVRIFLDAASVLEVIDLSGEPYIGGCRRWRGQALRRISCRALLGFACKEGVQRTGIVYMPDNDGYPVVLEADFVVRSSAVDESRFVSLSPVQRRIWPMFDKIYLDQESGMHVYHLKNPIQGELDQMGKENSFTEAGGSPRAAAVN